MQIQNRLFTAGLLILLPLAKPLASSVCTAHATLNEFERKAFLSAFYGQRDQVVAQLLATAGCNETMLNGLAHIPATVRFNDAKVGYALVWVRKDKILDLLDVPGVDSASASYAYYPYAFSDPT